jgi:hypothetical protein
MTRRFPTKFLESAAACVGSGVPAPFRVLYCQGLQQVQTAMGTVCRRATHGNGVKTHGNGVNLEARAGIELPRFA